MNYTSLKNPFHPFHHELDTFSPHFQHLFADFRLFLLFFVFSLKGLLPLRAANTSFLLPLLANQGDVPSLCDIKRERVGLWGYCHFAPPIQRPASLARSRRGVLSLRAADTNLIQREFSSNDAIASQKFSHAQNFSQKSLFFQTAIQRSLWMLPQFLSSG
jgi:hypothetical protein